MTGTARRWHGHRLSKDQPTRTNNTKLTTKWNKLQKQNIEPTNQPRVRSQNKLTTCKIFHTLIARVLCEDLRGSHVSTAVVSLFQTIFAPMVLNVWNQHHGLPCIQVKQRIVQCSHNSSPPLTNNAQLTEQDFWNRVRLHPTPPSYNAGRQGSKTHCADPSTVAGLRSNAFYLFSVQQSQQ